MEEYKGKLYKFPIGAEGTTAHPNVSAHRIVCFLTIWGFWDNL